MIGLGDISVSEWVGGEPIRHVVEDGDRWFVVADLCRAFRYGMNAAGQTNVTEAARHVAATDKRVMRLETHPTWRPPYSKLLMTTERGLLVMLAHATGRTPADTLRDPAVAAWFGTVTGAPMTAEALDTLVRAVEASPAATDDSSGYRRKAHRREVLFDLGALLIDPTFDVYWAGRTDYEAGRISRFLRRVAQDCVVTVQSNSAELPRSDRYVGRAAIAEHAYRFHDSAERLSSVYEAGRVDGAMVETRRIVTLRPLTGGPIRTIRVAEIARIEKGLLVAASQVVEAVGG